MGSFKYPYIPKEYFPAVMLACKIIREEGSFNKAINSAAKYYRVDKEELENHVRSRQGAGQKGKTRKYKYYVCCTCIVCEGPTEYVNPVVKKSTSSTNASNQIGKDYGGGCGAYGWESFGVCISEYESREEAETNMHHDYELYKLR